MFVTFEGGEATGKTTQIALLAERLRRRGVVVATTREPGGTALAEALRALLLGNSWSPLAETLLHNAARAEHVATLIGPALARGEWVLCDRFGDSTRAYQGQGDAVGTGIIPQLEAAIGLRPALTLVLEVEETERRRRLAARGGRADHYEALPPAFHDGVRAAFRAIALAEPDRCRLVDAGGDRDGVADRVWAQVAPLLSHAA